MKKILYLTLAAAIAAAAGVVYAWPMRRVPVGPMVALAPARPIADAPSSTDGLELPPVALAPDAPVVRSTGIIRASAQLPKVPPPPMPPVPVPGRPKLPSVPAPPIPKRSPPSVPTTPLPSVPPPTALPRPTPFVPPAQAAVGSVVLLKNNKIVEGSATRSGSKVIVRRGSIDQPYPADEVQFIGKSKDEAYRFLLSQKKPDDAAGRFKLARWCMYNGLREQALAESRAVVKLQPNHKAAAEMARALEESIRLFNGDGSSKAAVEAPREGATLPQVVEPAPDIPAEAATVFAPKVHPILVNLCADCHARPGYKGEFKMACGTTQDSDPSIAKHNLRAAVSQITRNAPGSSPLLVKALEAHGNMKQAAFKGRAAPAYRVLEAWVFMASGNGAKPAAAPMIPPPKIERATPPVPAKPEVKPVLPPVPPPSSASQFGTQAPSATPMPPSPENASTPVDEFDPSVYNRAVQAQPPRPSNQN